MAVPDYLRVVDSITARIASREWPPGHQLPSYRELATEYDVSVSTVQRALMILRDRGLIEGHQGKATYVRSVPHRSGS